MLNDTTKRKINSLRQILVGKVPDPKSQVEQITNALIYKYMDDMDRQAEVFGGRPSFFVKEYEKYAWRKLMDPKFGGQERMNLYMETLEKMGTNPNLSPIFRDILKNSYVPYRSSETLNLFLSEIDGFAYDHSEDLGDAFEYLLSIMGSQGDAGQFRTPRHIIDFIVEAVEPKKDQKILDPACGTAGFLISAYKHILKENRKENPGDKLTHDERQNLHKNFVGYDISPEMAKLSRVNMFLHNFPDPKIYEYDTLSSEERWNDHFDIILANPPFMSPKGGIIPHKKFRIPANRAEVLFTDYIVEHLKPKGKAGIIVPEGIIFQSATAYKDLRKMLVEEGLFAVVSLPAGVFNPYAGVKTSVLLLDKERAKTAKEILFLKIKNDGYDLGAQRREIAKNDLPEALQILAKWKEGKKEENKIALYVEKTKIAESGDYNLSGDRYHVATDYTNAKWPMVELGEICKILNGYAFKSENYVEEGNRIIRITNVQKGIIVDDDPKFYPIKTNEQIDSYKLFENDLLVSLTGNVGRVGLLPASMLPASLNQRVACVRITDNRITNSFLFHILNSDAFERSCILSSNGMAQKNMSTIWLSKYKIPLPPLEIQKQIVAELDGYQNIISGSRQVVENWKPKIEIDPTWGKVKLGDVCEKITDGSHNPPKEKNGGGHFMLSSQNVFDGYITTKNAREISEEDFKNENRRTDVKKGDVLLTIVGTIGRSAVVTDDLPYKITLQRSVAVLKTESKKLLSEYLCFILQSVQLQKDLENRSAGVAQKGIYLGQLNEIEIPLPPIEVQKQIVQKIEAERILVDGNKKLIEIYEEKTKESLVKLWDN